MIWTWRPTNPTCVELAAETDTGRNMTNEDFTFAAFSRNPFYQKLTDRLIELAEVKDGERIVDLACGTGLVTQRIMANLPRARDTVIIGVEHSAASL